jgi:hypothetical protein
MMDEILSAIGAVALAIVLLIFGPFLNFVFGWVVGWLIKITFGNLFIEGLSLFGLSLTKNSLPLFFGVIGVISSFFKRFKIDLNHEDN